MNIITMELITTCNQSFKFTPNGWRQAKTLSQKENKSNYAFIAMWFSPSLDIFTEAVKETCKKAGYEAFTILDKSHNDFIMNKVINAINKSKFVIADLTSIQAEGDKNGVRGGVYYEAGYAKGKGLEVIQTCRSDTQSRIHFDNKQINTLMWEQKEGRLSINDKDFIDELKDHIIRTVGRGLNYENEK